MTRRVVPATPNDVIAGLRRDVDMLLRRRGQEIPEPVRQQASSGGGIDAAADVGFSRSNFSAGGWETTGMGSRTSWGEDIFRFRAVSIDEWWLHLSEPGLYLISLYWGQWTGTFGTECTAKVQTFDPSFAPSTGPAFVAQSGGVWGGAGAGLHPLAVGGGNNSNLRVLVNRDLSDAASASWTGKISVVRIAPHSGGASIPEWSAAPCT